MTQLQLQVLLNDVENEISKVDYAKRELIKRKHIIQKELVTI